jgi:hypothetical protein
MLLNSGAAGFFTAAAGVSALLTMLHVAVLGALIPTGFADFGALAQQVLTVDGATGYQARGEGTDVGAVAVEADAGYHHFYVLLLQAGGSAPLAGGDAGIEGVEQTLMLVVHGLGD